VGVTTSSEQAPHIVYQACGGLAEVFPDYASAFVNWKSRHHWARPYLIATVGCVCSPAAEIVDVGE
jgi:hypothetical protein